MHVNTVPAYDPSDNPTGCCPRFNPDGWDDRQLHFQDKLFVRAVTRSEQHVPVDMGPVFEKTFAAIERAGAYDETNFIVLSRDLSASEAEHYFSVTKPVAGQEIVTLSGEYLTKVFEGPYEEAPDWEMQLKTQLAEGNHEAARIFYFYTTCPKCAQTYGKNFVVAVAELAGEKAPAS